MPRPTAFRLPLFLSLLALTPLPVGLGWSLASGHGLWPRLAMLSPLADPAPRLPPITARVFWPGGLPAPGAQDDISRALGRAFADRGARAIVLFETAADGRARILYEVGSSRIGPFPVSAAARGVRTAVEAAQLTALAAAGR